MSNVIYFSSNLLIQPAKSQYRKTKPYAENPRRRSQQENACISACRHDSNNI